MDSSDVLLEEVDQTQPEIADSPPSSSDLLPPPPPSLPAQYFSPLQRAVSTYMLVRRFKPGIRNLIDSNSDNDRNNVTPLDREPSPNQVTADTNNGAGNNDEHNREVNTLEWVFVTLNLLFEVVSAIFDQLSSVHKPRFALVSMLMSLATMLISVIEFVHKGRRERVKWMWKKDMLPWFYNPSPKDHRLFGSFADIIGLVCGFFQCISSTVAYVLMSRHIENPIKICFLPIIFAFGLLCSKIFGNRGRIRTR